MERSLRLLLLLIVSLAIILIVQAQSQQGFISLDCGLHANEPSPYKEPKTGLQFSSDATFIQSGKTGRIQANLEADYLKPSTTLRYFPEGTRNCYNLKVEKGRNHLIRARFVYGNYDGLDISPKFDLYLGPNPWVTIDLQKQVNGTRTEILHIPTSNKLQICLVKTGDTTPLISALEVRPMGNDSYLTKSGSLKLYYREYFSKSDSSLRYPGDVYDRQWNSFFEPEWTQISTTSNVGNSNDYEPPKVALSTAAIPTNASAPLTNVWGSVNTGEQYYVYAHFAEIQELQANETREFNMVLNGKLFFGPVVPPKLSITIVLSVSPDTCEGGLCNLQLIRTNRSTLPPLLNAYEVYKVIQFPQSETNENDVVAVKNIQATYGLSRINWQSDPCVPQQFMWDGLNCSITDISTPPRITTLNLSSSGLTGTITAAIQNLTTLEKLDLSNNNLTGEVPEFLGNMKSLVVINLSGNNLNGTIPQSLQRKGLELLFEGNPMLVPLGQPTKPHKTSFLVPIVASVTSVATLIVVLVLFLVFRKKKPSNVEVVHPPPSRPPMNVTYANSSEPSIEMKKRRFTYSEVMKMTNNFERVVGEGGFGVVCHGTVNGSEQVAVKLLSQSSTQGYKEFKAEVDLLLRVHHTNLVSLVGYCDEGDHLALIYEFVPNGDLRQHLSGKGGKPIVNWGTRLRIAAEAALDVKSTNILLDEHYKAKLADFGLLRSFPIGGESHVSTVIAGTPGYLDPEYYHTSRLGEKSDVYSFGIVLLEMITNQPVIDRNRRKSHITQWVGSELNGGDITKIMDPKLNGDYDSRSAWRALELAMSCADKNGSITMDKNGSITMVDVVYSWLPPKCETCGQLGHKATRCLGLSLSSSLPQVTEVVANATSAPVASPVQSTATTSFPKLDLDPSNSETIHVDSVIATPMAAIAIEIDTTTSEVTAPVTAIGIDSSSTSTYFSPSSSESAPLAIATPKAAPNVTQTADISPFAPATTEIESTLDLSTPLLSTDTPSKLKVNDQQDNILPPPSLNLDAPIHTVGKTSVCMSEENEEDGVEEEGCRFASGYEDESTQRSRGGRPLKPTQKMQEMQWTIVGGRGHRGRGSRGGRGNLQL